MCGIRVLVEFDGIADKTSGTAPKCSEHSENSADSLHSIPSWLNRRGPDHVSSRQWTLSTIPCSILLQTAVLQMRTQLVQQPVPLLVADATNNNNNCSYLAWNGEVYQTTAVAENANGDDDDDYDDDTYRSSVSDTRLVARLVEQALHLDTVGNIDNHSSLLHQRLAHQLRHLVNAEYAMCIVVGQYIFYSRDVLGRRSLLVKSRLVERTATGAPSWQLASVATPGATKEDTTLDCNWEEVEPNRLYCFDCSTRQTTSLDLFARPPQPSAPTNMSVSLPSTDESCQSKLLLQTSSSKLESLLAAAVQRRVHAAKDTAGVAVLFSGGLDSAVLAALALRYLDCLSLVTVNFVEEEEDVISSNGGSSKLSADAIQARQSFQDLMRMFPDKQIHLVEATKSWADIASIEQHVQSLIYPKSTVMDFNIATALWFAAKAAPSECRILLSGLGADELLGGYRRHQTAYCNGGHEAFRQELALDFDRLWDRNLGRDGRVLSDTSKEVRYPFLDPKVVSFAQQLPLQCLLGHSNETSPLQPDKYILRVLAHRLGLTSAAQAPKRAIQFGSRLSQIADKRRYGSRRKARQQNA